jgi:transitional endoplasmic reticulum ATPase
VWEEFVKGIEVGVREWLRANSIFKGKAINSDFTFMDLRYFDPSRRVVYSQNEQIKLGGEVFAPIVATRQWLADGGRLKRGALLYGGYGTGKSLTMMYVAKLCERNGWTFVNVKDGTSVKRALEFAMRYQPAVVAIEDIDRSTGRERTDSVNDIIDKFDNVVTKGSEVMVIMTTNHKENISPAMLRPGRIDSIIEMGILDPQAGRRGTLPPCSRVLQCLHRRGRYPRSRVRHHAAGRADGRHH